MINPKAATQLTSIEFVMGNPKGLAISCAFCGTPCSSFSPAAASAALSGDCAAWTCPSPPKCAPPAKHHKINNALIKRMTTQGLRGLETPENHALCPEARGNLPHCEIVHKPFFRLVEK